ncbi:MAG: DegT/DnrJ/EryC1/StrS family aminotransferase, partial [Alphaproteobacteria bacterium]
MTPSIPFIDLAQQQALIRPQLEAALTAVLDHGQYIMGPEVHQLEADLAAFCGAKHAISCSSGTDALMLALMAMDLKPGQGVIVPSFTFAASAEVMPCLGAIPVFAEIDPVTFNLDADRLGDAKAAAEAKGINVVGIISVGLFGQPADYDAIKAFADSHGLWLIDDAAQSFGASWQGKAVGHLGAITATSFFPAKPLGCYGDGGAIFTDRDDFAEIMTSARIHGMGRVRYTHDRIGMTARLDSMQAAVLIEKLRLFAGELTARQGVADRYAEGLKDVVRVPQLAAGATSSWAQYVITLPQGANRQAIQERLNQHGVPTAIYYPMGMHQQTPYAHYPVAEGGLPITEDLCHRVLALPMHPYFETDTQS